MNGLRFVPERFLGDALSEVGRHIAGQLRPLVATIPQNMTSRALRAASTLRQVAENLTSRVSRPTDVFVAGEDVSIHQPDVTGSPEVSNVFKTKLTAGTTIDPDIRLVLSQYPELLSHPQSEVLLDIVCGPTDVGADGFARISKQNFHRFNQEVPHLFQNGLELLNWFDTLQKIISDERTPLESAERESAIRAVSVLRRLVQSAAITAPSDLWLARQILATHKALGISDIVKRGGEVSKESLARTFSLDVDQLGWQLDFLYTRGYLDKTAQGYIRSSHLSGRVFEQVETLSDGFRCDMAGVLVRWLAGEQEYDKLVESWLQNFHTTKHDTEPFAPAWVASYDDIQLGYHLLPLVLALRVNGFLDGVQTGQNFHVPNHLSQILPILERAGLILEGRVTALGKKVFSRGPGPFGIIGAYFPYLNKLEGLLRNDGTCVGVEREGNIARSRDANQKMFRDAVRHLHNLFVGNQFPVVIEHACGLGEGIRAFTERFGEGNTTFVFADFGQVVIDNVKKEKGLPQNKYFIRADISKPEELLSYLQENGIPSQEAVMVVGNGFHEVRGKNDRQIVEAVRKYREAGIHLVFIEESALSLDQIREAAWSSYHAGFRYVHHISGQVLRSPVPYAEPMERLSWLEVLELAGYQVDFERSHGTRPLFPYFEDDMAKNPRISNTYIAHP